MKKGVGFDELLKMAESYGVEPEVIAQDTNANAARIFPKAFI